MKKEKETTKVEEVLTKTQCTAIEKYLHSRFSQYGVKWYQFKYEEMPEGYTYQAKFIQELTPEALGIFRHALKTCTFEAKVWKSDKNGILVECHLTYSHIGGGSNGCDLDVKFNINPEGEISEIYI